MKQDVEGRLAALSRRNWAVVLVVGLLGAWGAWALNDEPTVPEDELNQLVEGLGFETHPPLGGPGEFGASGESPVSLGSLKPNYSQVDVSITGPFGALSLKRFASGAPGAWRLEKSPGLGGAPFGYARDANGFLRLRWWHNLHSYITARLEPSGPCSPPSPGCETEEVTYWEVHGGPAGTAKTFLSCDAHGCFGQNYSEQDIKLQYLAGEGFVVHAPDGRYHYRSVGGVEGFWYLSYIESAQYDEANCSEPTQEDAGVDVAASCHRRLARLNYEALTECAGSTPAETNLTNGVGFPRLRSAVAANGARLVFHYQRMLSAVPELLNGKTHECVLASVDLVGRDGTVESSVVTYDYAASSLADGGTQIVAGLLEKAEWPDRDGGSATGSVVEYAYQSAGAAIWEIKRDGATLVRQVLGGDGGTVSEDYDGEAWPSATSRYFITAEVNGCWPGVFQPTGACMSQDQTFTTYSRSIGDGSGYFAQLVRHKFTVTSTGRGPIGDQGPTVRASQTTVQCGQSCPGIEGFVASDEAWYVGSLDAGTAGQRAVDVAAGGRHPNGAYTVYDHELASGATPSGAPILPPSELRKTFEGAASNDGTGALLEKDYTYTYGGIGRPAPTRAFEQLVETASSPSTFSDETPGLKQETRRQYDPVTNRLKATVRTGHTLTFSTQANSWSRQQRSVGTFSLTHDVCASEAVSDPLGRVRTVMGPCKVSGAQPTACDAGTAVPLTVYAYWASSEMSNRAGRVKEKRSYPNGCGSTPIVTAYDAYDARGRLTQWTDANGGVTRYEYEGSQLVKKISAAGDAQLEAVTEYGYDNGSTHGDYVRHPDGRYEVLCYRTGTSTGQGCVGGVRTTLLQWKATSAGAAGATHTERVDYTYHLGELRSETFRDGANQVRRTRFYDGDPLARQTFEAWGAGWPSLPSEARYSKASLFDRQGNKVGMGKPYQPLASDPEPFCGGFEPGSLSAGAPRQPASPHCNAFAYDRLNRLVGMLEPVDTSSSSGDAVKMCLAYDKAGNVSSVRQGCPRGAGPAGDCSQCGQPLLEYRHDDFGNLVRVDVPWGSGPQEASEGPAGRGRYQYEYDEAGNLIRKQTPTMAAAPSPQWVENSYDKLNRILKSEAVNVVGSVASRETLFWYSYDQTETPPWGCPGYDSLRPARAMGRAQVLTDSFGDTWYQYDAHGNVIGVARSRALPNGTPRTRICLDARLADFPSIHRYYDRTGRLVNEAYPGGRGTWYHYYDPETGMPHRVKSLDVTTWNGEGFANFLKIVEDVQWEPFGGLRSYVLVAPKAAAGAQKARVTYHSGGSNQPLSSCSGTGFTGGTDTTGRLSGLTVSKLESGGSLGDIFKRAYTWKADQLLQEDTCLLETGNVPPSSVRYADSVSGAPGYDARLQVRQAHRVANASAAAGGAFGSRAYSYDERGNRTLDVQDGWRFKGEYESSGSRVDLLTARYLEGAQCGGSVCPPRFAVTQRYDYDADGRVSRIASYKNRTDAVSSPFHALNLDATTDGAHAAVGSVYRQVSDNEGRTYEYFYDAEGRRRLKRYWLSGEQGVLEDEYFYDGTRLLEDWGHTSFDPDTADSVHDEYLWLADRPIGFFKVRISRAGQRVEDFMGDCPRNGEPAPCGFYFLVTDGLGKPVLALDSYRRISGVADYDPYGHVNRTTLVADSPVLGTGQNALMATAQVPSSSTLVSQLRARFPVLDVQGGSGAYLADASGTLLNGVDGTSSLMSNTTTFGAVSKWVAANPSGNAQVRFQSAATSGAVQEVALGAVEYRRFQSGAAPVWTPLRFPGQYHDEETDFFENRNRFYEPSTGRYLGSELMMRDPKWVVTQATAGRSAPVYAYAYNNPMAFKDPDGNMGVGGSFGGSIFSSAFEFLYETLSLQGAAQGSAQVIAFADNDDLGKGEHGVALTGGAVFKAASFVGSEEGISSLPAQDGPVMIAGAGAGISAGFIVTTANNMSDFEGISDTLNIDLPLMSISIAWSPSATSVSIGSGKGYAIGMSSYKTYTRGVYVRDSALK